MAATKIPFRSTNTWAIIPHDTDSFDPALSALFIGGAAGNVAVRHLVASGATMTVATDTFAVAAGQVVTLGHIIGVNSTSTTATGIIGVSE